MKAFRTLLFIALISTVSSAQVPQAIFETPAWPEKPPESWLTYHLAHPGPGAATPGDPNPAFFWNGRYHLHYIYKNHTGFVFAHVSSEDMVHWKWHPTVLGPSTIGHGMFSGTGFITKAGRAAGLGRLPRQSADSFSTEALRRARPLVLEQRQTRVAGNPAGPEKDAELKPERLSSASSRPTITCHRD